MKLQFQTGETRVSRNGTGSSKWGDNLFQGTQRIIDAGDIKLVTWDARKYIGD
ncbi:hypothetical protein [Bacteroides sp. GM023]|uniref:hypothetical protein n=1 Tax=Bacteroides sp. GM023 TaxID=2723058 RepID=UPI00168BFB16|nr:hypothetical protein [Bacteroides sp. GM023]MBD3590557.1 hypothetical protein [Bacteroides sp. GM023]